MSDLVNKVAEILNTPVDLVQRSAEARAAASGVSVDDVLSSWAGGESIAASAPKEEAPVEEAPKEEAVVEKTVEEEAPVEEAPKEEAVVATAVTRQVTKGVVSSILMNTNGTGYTSQPSITIVGGGGTTATC